VLTPEDMHHYQVRAHQHVLQHRDAMLWMQMGLGKTIVALTSINTLMAFGDITKTLIIAPLRVAETVWEHEAKSWNHTQHFRFSKILGPEKKRMTALFNVNADIYLINYENLPWLVAQLEHHFIRKGLPLPFQMAVWDEVSKMKNSTTNRGKAVRKILPYFTRRIGLTGTPASNGLQDLHGQFLVVDQGDRLETHITHFRDQYLYQDSYSGKWVPFTDSQQRIEAKIWDITLQMSAADYLELPDFIQNDVYITLPPKVQRAYTELERDMITQLDDEQGGHEIAVFNAAALTNKCLQFANGAYYPEVGEPHFNSIHNLKLKAIEEIRDGTGDNVLIAYNYRSDAIRIMKAFPDAVNLSGLKGEALMEAVNSWNSGNIRMLIGHPASMGHGLNLQHGGHTIIWFGLNWSLDLTDQMNARLYRQGQGQPVICHRIMIEGTVESAVYSALQAKAQTQDELRAAISKYVDTKR